MKRSSAPIAAEVVAPSGLVVPRGRTAARLMVVSQVQGLQQLGRSQQLGNKVLIRAASIIDESDLTAVTGWQAEWSTRYRYDQRRGKVITSQTQQYLDLTLSYQEGGDQADAERLAQCLAEGLSREGLRLWQEQPAAAQWISRVAWLLARRPS